LSGFLVKQAGVLTLTQDFGRYGSFNLGLTNGGAVDSLAYKWANKLCRNELGLTTLEVTVGGVEFEAQTNTAMAITGANMPLQINGEQKVLWRSHTIQDGDIISLGYASRGTRCYVAVAQGFIVKPQFGSSSTVCRENIGGLNGGKLLKHDFLSCINQKPIGSKPNQMLEEKYQPTYDDSIRLRTVPSYQQKCFSSFEQRLFYSSEYDVSQLCDRMGYRLTGRKIKSNITGILSEGICPGAIQIPADGQPIVLLNDRQTIGGYPKIGAVIASDTAKLSQLSAGQKVHFDAISMEAAHNIHHLALSLFKRTLPIHCH
jgi:biotin-dependent carboxylase-like uncharacterized protein